MLEKQDVEDNPKSNPDLNAGYVGNRHGTEKRDFAGKLFTRDETHQVTGSIEIDNRGGWFGVFIQPSSVEGILDTECSLTIGTETKLVCLGPFLPVGHWIAICFRNHDH
jgi:hypothetical protein